VKLEKKMIKNVRHTAVIVTDMEKALGFYRDLLGLKVVLDKQQEGELFARLLALESVKMRVVMLEAPDGYMVELFEFPSHRRKAPDSVEMCNIGCSHIGFRVEDMDDTYEKLLEKGLKCNSEPLVTPDGYAKVIYCHDPDGTIIELVEILNTDKNPYKESLEAKEDEYN